MIFLIIFYMFHIAHIRSSIIVFFLFFFINLFFIDFSFSNNINNSINLDKIIININNKIILKSDLENYYKDYFYFEKKSLKFIKYKILKKLIINRITINQFGNCSIDLIKKNIDINLERKMSYILNYFKLELHAIECFNKSIIGIRSYLKSNIKDFLIFDFMINKLTLNLLISPLEVKKFFNEFYVNKEFYYPSKLKINQIIKLNEFSDFKRYSIISFLNKISFLMENENFFYFIVKKYSEDISSLINKGFLSFNLKKLDHSYTSVLLMSYNLETKLIESDLGFHLMHLVNRKTNFCNNRHVFLKNYFDFNDIKYSLIYLNTLSNIIFKNLITFNESFKLFSDDFFFNKNNFNNNNAIFFSDDLDFTTFFIINNFNIKDIYFPGVFLNYDIKKVSRIFFLKKIKSSLRFNNYNKVYDFSYIFKKKILFNS